MRNVSVFVFLMILFIAQNGSAQSPVTSQTPSDAVIAPPTPANETSKRNVLSYLEWKAERVAEAQKKLEQVAKTSEGADWQEGKSGELDAGGTNLKTSEQKLIFNVDVALQLNIHDYFSMYLKSLSLNEFSEATKKLTPTEAGELLLAYKNSLEKEKKISLKLSKIPKDNAKSKNQEIQ